MVNYFPMLLFIYGAITLVGGAAGYFKGKSRISLIVGSIAGAALFISGYLLSTGDLLGLRIGEFISVFLLVMFVNRYLKTKAVMPAGLMALISLCVILVLTLVR